MRDGMRGKRDSHGWMIERCRSHRAQGVVACSMAFCFVEFSLCLD